MFEKITDAMKEEEIRLLEQLGQIRKAMAELGATEGQASLKIVPGGQGKPKGRQMSAAGRAAIAKAAKARWAAYRKAKRKRA